MGRSKALLKLGGISLLRHSLNLARETGFAARVIRRDVVPRCGPLGGVYTAAAQSSYPAILVLSCDMPFVTAGLLKDLMAQYFRQGKACFAAQNQKPGFPFILSCEALPQVGKLIQEQRYSLWELADALDAILLERPAGSRELLNINTPEEFEAARAWSSKAFGQR
jgi:molybdenum cofactor guanylyltransferase